MSIRSVIYIKTLQPTQCETACVRFSLYRGPDEYLKHPNTGIYSPGVVGWPWKDPNREIMNINLTLLYVDLY